MQRGGFEPPDLRPNDRCTNSAVLPLRTQVRGLEPLSLAGSQRSTILSYTRSGQHRARTCDLRRVEAALYPTELVVLIEAPKVGLEPTRLSALD